MTWDQLLGKIREGLDESGAYIRVLGDLLAKAIEEDDILDDEQAGIAFTLLSLAMSDLHSTVEHVTIGLDAVVGTLREADESQEAKRD